MELEASLHQAIDCLNREQLWEDFLAAVKPDPRVDIDDMRHVLAITLIEFLEAAYRSTKL